MRVNTYILAGVLAISAQAGLADCPVAEDLKDGIRLVRNEPFFGVVMRTAEQGLEESFVLAPGAAPEAVSSRYSHALTAIQRVTQTGVLEMEYSEDFSMLDQLPASRVWNSDVSLKSEGTVLTTGTYEARITGFGEALVGDCAYSVWRISETLILEGLPPSLFEKTYSPDLGILLGAIILTPEGAPISSVYFDEISVEQPGG